MRHDGLRIADHRHLCSRSRFHLMVRPRAFAGRPVFVRHRSESESCRPERDPGPAVHRRRICLLGSPDRVAGVLLASKLRIGQASVGLEYLLPALVGAFLGSTTIKPGRVNVWGTLVGVAVLAVGISGIQQLGADFYVEPLFNGVTLIASIGIAGYAQRKRIGSIEKRLSASALAGPVRAS